MKQSLKIIISGMHCTACSLNIDGELEDLDGVYEASTNYARQETQVSFDPKKITQQNILKTIEGLGYGAQVAV